MRVEDMKAVVLWSGGIDSTTLVHRLLNDGMEVFPINFDYGQTHRREIQLSQKFVQPTFYRNSLLHDTVTAMISVPLKSALTSPDEVELPKGLYDQANQKVTVVPNRNMMFLSLAAAYAISIGAGYIAYGAHFSDRATYPDCRPEFVESCEKTIQVGNYEKVKIFAPFLDMRKTDIIAYGLATGLDYSMTWSCYAGGRTPCLSCGTCTERTEAFFENNTKDPALSPKKWKEALRIYKRYLEEKKP